MVNRGFRVDCFFASDDGVQGQLGTDNNQRIIIKLQFFFCHGESNQ
jgi:hypothetical protein